MFSFPVKDLEGPRCTISQEERGLFGPSSLSGPSPRVFQFTISDLLCSKAAARSPTALIKLHNFRYLFCAYTPIHCLKATTYSVDLVESCQRRALHGLTPPSPPRTGITLPLLRNQGSPHASLLGDREHENHLQACVQQI